MAYDRFWGNCTFGQMLFASICWSSDESANMAMPDGVQEITRGLWAGDRFYIVSLDDAEEFVQGDGWEDVMEQSEAPQVPLWESGLPWDGR
ncbi:hypothetical protein BDQ17DRAFT_1420432 [Cyathus striatus]|nr:hypothetical protein BDQ17DRAFT_1420432 [Cyathus striatus]